MNKSVVAVLSVIFVLSAGITSAQDNQEPVEIVSRIVPAEVWTCSYNDGQGPQDLDDAVDAWTEYMNENGADDYAAWTLTRHYYSAEQDFDFIWLGAWKDGNAMGQGTDMLYSTGTGVLGNFFRVASCDNHINAGSIAYRIPDGGANAANTVLTFSNCSIEEGANYSQVVEATKAGAEVLDGTGSQAGIYHWFPIYGGGDADMDFIWLGAYPGHAALGADYERMTNGELVRQRNALFAGLLDCDVTRVYNAQSRRAAQIR